MLQFFFNIMYTANELINLKMVKKELKEVTACFLMKKKHFFSSENITMV